jgi:hypothetical protein
MGADFVTISFGAHFTSQSKTWTLKPPSECISNPRKEKSNSNEQPSNHQRNRAMKPHPHAALAIQYWTEAAMDSEAWRNWDYKPHDEDEWTPCSIPPNFSPKNQFRRRPRTINLNGIDVPEPLRVAPEIGSEVFAAVLTAACPTYTAHPLAWRGDASHHLWLKYGLIHLTREAAETHARALLSFTTTGEVQP